MFLTIKYTGKTYAIKRQIADEYLVRAAAEFPSVDLMENCEIAEATFSPGGNTPAGASTAGFWSVRLKKDNEEKTLTCAMLLICDGSTSYLV
jgi:2-polyprenyl-6-methoxyphenol hydroxylase-like FAD-dependent oxidoreductase